MSLSADSDPVVDAAAPELARSIALLRAFQAGDVGACNELLARYRPRLVRIVRTRLGRALRLRVDEEDIVQETLLVASERLATFELRSHAGLLQWLARIADHVILSKHAHHGADKRSPKREVRLDETGGPAESIYASSTLSPSRSAQRAELEALVDSAVEDLEPPEYREVILLRDYYLEDWEEVRRQLDRSTVAAAQELHRRAHRRLREVLRPYLDERK